MRLALAFLLLVSLGGWQLYRLDWKQDLLAHMHAQMEAPAIDLNVAQPPDDLDYRHVKISGEYLHTPPFLMPSRVRNGQVGYHVVNLLKTENQGIWLINRGWVAIGQEKNVPLPTGPQTISGIARKPPTPAYFTPPNNAAQNTWFFYAPDEMSAAAKLEAPAAAWVIEADKTTDTPPLGGVTQLDIPNNHFQYALTWFALAGVLVVVALVRTRQ